MKKYFFFLIILVIGCGTSKKEKLEFLNKTEEYNEMREDYLKDVMGRFKEREFYAKQIEKLQKDVENLETYKDWPASEEIKQELYKQVIEAKNLLNSNEFAKTWNDTKDMNLGMGLIMDAVLSSMLENKNNKIKQLIKDERARVDME